MDSTRIRVDVCWNDGEADAVMAREVRDGLLGSPKSIPSKYFYDARGSKLFEAITRLDEYYVTRAENALLDRVAGEVAETARPVDLVELGPGYGTKTHRLIDACHEVGSLRRYVPIEVSPKAVEGAAATLASEYPWLEIHVVVGDFVRHLARLPDAGRALVAFLGGTIGNFPKPRAAGFLAEIRRLLAPDGRLLLGTDLVKDPDVLHAAYNDSRGVTAEFNLNMLRVLNDRLDADFDLDAFEHLAFYDDALERIEMHVRSLRRQRVRLRGIDLEVDLDEGETIRTEVSCKYTRRSVERVLGKAGLELESWHTDGPFALTVSKPSPAGVG